MSRWTFSAPRRGTSASRFGREHSPFLAYVVPWATIMLGSMLTALPLVSGLPLVPPFGFLMLLAWRFVRPGLLPVWAGLPLGLWDDLFSGQPLGSAILLWSLALIAIEVIEARFPWRGFVQDWFTAGLLVLAYILLGTLLSGAFPTLPLLSVLWPQFVLSLLIFPFLSRIVARLDRFRLHRWRMLGR